jgi:hypothetical protein
MYAALSNVAGVSSVFLYENDKGTVDVNGVPGHSIWAIVGPSGLSPAVIKTVAEAIYYKRNAGCGMRGNISYSITQADGSLFTVLFDLVASQPFYAQFTASPINPAIPPNLTAILAQLPTVFSPGVGSEININALATAIQSIDPNTLVTNAGFSLLQTGPFASTLMPSALYNQLTLLSQNIYALPMQILPYAPSILHATSQQFSAAGGTQTGLVWSLSISGSGGSITSGGLYTAGAVYPSTDVIQVQDSNGNTQTTSVSVI